MNKEDLSKLNEEYLKYISYLRGITHADENFIFSGASGGYEDYSDYSDYSDD